MNVGIGDPMNTICKRLFKSYGLNFRSESAKIAYTILKLCSYSGYTVEGLYLFFRDKKNLEVSYHSIYRIVKKLLDKGFLKHQYGSLLVSSDVGVALYRRISGALTCFSHSQSFDTTSQRVCRRHPKIVEAQKLLYSHRFDFKYLSEDEKKASQRALSKIVWNYVDYVKDCTDRVIILKAKNVFLDIPPYLVIPYHTKWSSPRRFRKVLSDFWDKIEYLSEKYDKAVFLTLTTKTTSFTNLGEAIDSLFRAWKRLYDHIKKKCLRNNLAENLDYIAVLEFGKENFMPHLHIIVFGVDYLDFKDFRKKNVSKEEKYKKSEKSWEYLKDYWEKWHKSRGIYVYGLKKVCSKGRYTWHWKNPKNKPRDAGGRDAVLYLAKYITKTLKTIKKVRNLVLAGELSEAYKTKFIECVALLWASQKQFVRSSRIPLERDDENQSSGLYEFFGVFYKAHLPCFVLDAINYYYKRQLKGFWIKGSGWLTSSRFSTPTSSSWLV